MKPFEGKTAIVTGAAQGIGRATAIRLARDGARVALADRAAAQCEQVRASIEAAGGTAIAIAADLETKEGVDGMIEQTLAAWGTIDIAAHNVGGTIHIKPFWEYSDEEIQAEISRSLWPTLRCCRAVIPVMLRQGRGTIVNIGSVATREIYRVPYSAAKGGVHAMTVCLAMELAKHDIRVNCVAPGKLKQGDRAVVRHAREENEDERRWRSDIINQPLRDTYLPRRGTDDEVAAAVAFFA
ncbi:MAG: 1,6-dihydroxycyclohexa-2,4-diene-carboxylate dehydrogenase, partial [Noviherbaspirillum sp.]|nr:1,6-dihydroxycyclohexa-2,4-diene-carboxylate dehydrogenase [Noviherbaspirillum sp.]